MPSFPLLSFYTFANICVYLYMYLSPTPPPSPPLCMCVLYSVLFLSLELWLCNITIDVPLRTWNSSYYSHRFSHQLSATNHLLLDIFVTYALNLQNKYRLYSNTRQNTLKKEGFTLAHSSRI